jgi:hypothetical protein
MSADNWSVCPVCERRNKKSLYGVVSEEEYLESLRARKKQEEEYSLREDYEFRIDDDSRFDDEVFLIISYSCHCSVCGFDYNFLKKETIKIDEKLLDGH